MRAVRSEEAVTICWPSRLKAALRTQSLCPFREPICRPVARVLDALPAGQRERFIGELQVIIEALERVATKSSKRR
jgi:hypothetical protein